MRAIVRNEYWGTAAGLPNLQAISRALDALCVNLWQLNESPLRRLDGGLEETLALGWRGVTLTPRPASPATNMLGLVEHRMGSVDRWRDSNQKQRWRAATLLDIEPRLRRVRGYHALRQFCEALQKGRTTNTKVVVA